MRVIVASVGLASVPGDPRCRRHRDRRGQIATMHGDLRWGELILRRIAAVRFAPMASQVPGCAAGRTHRSLSLATDLGLGLPQEHVLRQTVVATRLAAAADLTDNEQAAVFYVSLLAWVGCVADSHEIAGWFGDDLRLRADSYEVDKTGLPMLRFMLSHVGDGAKPLRRITLVGRFLAGGFHDAMDSFVAHCQTTSDIAERLELPDAVRRALPQAFARWDGNGVPSGLRGAEIDPVMRIVQIADDAEVCHRTHGIDATLDLLRARSGTEFDPALVELCVRTPERIFGDLDTIDAWDVVIAGCADLDRTLDTHQLSAALETLGDYADLKCPWFLGHSRAVAALSADAAARRVRRRSLSVLVAGRRRSRGSA